MSLIRSRWAALGAAVAVTLGAGGIGLVSATQPSDSVVFVPITPCRLFDTRPEFQVGDRSAPLGPGDIHTLTATGSNGDCTDIPTSATAVSMNMTATDATAPTFLTVWAAGETRPDASSMNPIPGSPATPNGVISALDEDGEFSVFNLAGSVHVLADINGYYVDHDHDDRYLQLSALGSRGLYAQVTVRVSAFPEVTAQRLSNGETATVTRNSIGSYTVRFPGFATEDGLGQHVQLTAVSAFLHLPWRECNPVFQTTLGDDFYLQVSCADTSTSPPTLTDSNNTLYITITA